MANWGYKVGEVIGKTQGVLAWQTSAAISEAWLNGPAVALRGSNMVEARY